MVRFRGHRGRPHVSFRVSGQLRARRHPLVRLWLCLLEMLQVSSAKNNQKLAKKIWGLKILNSYLFNCKFID